MHYARTLRPNPRLDPRLDLVEPVARHPFRQAFVESRVARAKRSDDGDLKLFALSFAAFFICFYTFLF